MVNGESVKYRMALFASGAGSNVQKIIDHFRAHTSIAVASIVCNNPNAGVIKIAQKENIPLLMIEKKKFQETGYVDKLVEAEIDLIVLAGFLWRVPAKLVHAFPQKIINIHPALLPNYGGKGMYGKAVHEAVMRSGDSESGITIHYVDEEYDHGNIILQKKCAVHPMDDATILAKRVQQLEHQYFAEAIEALLLEKES